MKKIILCLSILAMLIIPISADYAEDDEAGMISVDITAGWNLIPFHTDGFSNDYASAGVFDIPDEEYIYPIDEDVVESVWIYDIDTKEYIGGDAGYNEDLNAFSKKIRADDFLNAYYTHSSMWYYFKEDGKIVLSLKLEDFASLDDFELVEGWNFIHVVPDMVGESFDNMPGDCEITKIAFWNAEDQEWYIPEQGHGEWSHEVTNEAVGIAMLVKVSDDCSFAGSAVNPPSIPE